MLTLFHYSMSLPSRYVRLAFGEYGEELALVEEKPWARRQEFIAVNPANTLPLLLAEGDQPVIGPQVIIEYLDETRAPISPIGSWIKCIRK
jgi:glutathione S-transferase